MARETKSRKIDGDEYTCTQFPPQKALRILTKLTKHIGEPLAVLMKAEKGETKNLLNKDISELFIGEAIAALGGSLGDDDLYDLAQEVCESVIINMKATKKTQISGQLEGAIFDEQFTGPKGLKTLFKVVGFALEVNYGDFLGDIVGKRSPASQTISA